MVWEQLGQVGLQSICSILVLFVLTKWMGNRQVSQLTMFDYITGISIGSIAAEMASHPEAESWLGLLAMGIYALVTVAINDWNKKSLKARRFFLGAPLMLYDQSKLYYQNLKKAKLDLNELTAACRTAGYFDLNQLQMILMEVNGQLSFLSNESSRPLTPADVQQQPAQQRPAVAVVMDGVVFPDRLKAVGLNEEWLQKQMKAQKIEEYAQIFLATVDNNQALTVYEKLPRAQGKEYFA